MNNDKVDHSVLTKIPCEGLNRAILIGLAIVFLSAIAFTQLPFRAQGRIVEVLTLGDWPMEWAVRRQFERRGLELRSVINFVNDAPSLTGLTIAPTGLRASRDKEGWVESEDFDNPDILQALISIEADAVNVHEDRVSVLLGVEDRGGSTFEVAYIYPLKPVNLPDCETFSAMDRPKAEACVFQLSSHWYVRYLWYPADIDEFQEALDELEESPIGDRS